MLFSTDADQVVGSGINTASRIHA